MLIALPELPMIWPLGLLHHRHDPHCVSRFEAWAIGILAGWWTWAILSILPDAPQEIGFGIVDILALGCILIRPHRYCAGHASPLSIAGRLATGQWIIPGYDRVFCASRGLCRHRTVDAAVVVASSTYGSAAPAGRRA